MSLSELKYQVDSLANAWEEFKSLNDRRLTDIERKGAADPILNEQLDHLNQTIDSCKGRINQIEVSLSRPSGGDTLESDDQKEYTEVFRNYIRKGIDQPLAALEQKSLSAGSDPDGGYLVTPRMSDQILKIIQEKSPIRQLVSNISISTDSIEFIHDADNAEARWTSETGAVEDTATPQLSKFSIAVHEMYAQPKATQKLIDDASVNIEQWLASKIADAFAETENNAFFHGDGNGKPRGFLTYPDGNQWGNIEQVVSGSDGEITADSLISLFYSLKDTYSKQAVFIINRTVLQSIRLLKLSGTEQYIWQPGLTNGQPDTLLGVPVYQADEMPDADSDSLSIALGDFRRAYQIIDRTGIRVLRDPFTHKPFVKFYSTKRVGGDVMDFNAIKILRLGV